MASADLDASHLSVNGDLPEVAPEFSAAIEPTEAAIPAPRAGPADGAPALAVGARTTAGMYVAALAGQAKAA